MQKSFSRILLSSALIFAASFVTTNASAFSLSSTEIKAGQRLSSAQVFKGFGCSGGNTSPLLAWKDLPKGTKSLALTVYDPDAPTGSGWWHWIVYDLPNNSSGLLAGVSGAPDAKIKLPAGAKQGRNDYGTRDFGGACPPVGDKPHRYIFTVHALKVEKLEVPDDASAALIGYMLNANSLGKATLTATYGR